MALPAGRGGKGGEAMTGVCRARGGRPPRGRNGKDVRYRLRKLGYVVLLRERLLLRPAAGRRSWLMEERMRREFGFGLAERPGPGF